MGKFYAQKVQTYIRKISKFQVGALATVEAKKRFEFLEAVGNMMDAQLQFFKKVFLLP